MTRINGMSPKNAPSVMPSIRRNRVFIGSTEVGYLFDNGSLGTSWVTRGLNENTGGEHHERHRAALDCAVAWQEGKKKERMERFVSRDEDIIIPSKEKADRLREESKKLKEKLSKKTNG